MMGAANLKNKFANECFTLLKHIAKDPDDLDARRRLGAVLGSSLSDPAKSEINESTYRRVLTHDDPDIVRGAQAFLDKFLAWGFQPVTDFMGLTFCVAVDVRRQFGDIIGEFDSVGGLDAWIAAELGITANRVSTFPEPMAPWSLLPSITNQTLQVFATQSGQRGALVSRNQRKSDTSPATSDLRLFYATIAGVSGKERDTLAARIASHVMLSVSPPEFDAHYTLAGQSVPAKLSPVRMGLPFTMALDFAFIDGAESLKSALSGMDAPIISLDLVIGDWGSDQGEHLEGIGFRFIDPQGLEHSSLFCPLSEPFLNTLALRSMFKAAAQLGVGFVELQGQRISATALSEVPVQVLHNQFARTKR